MANIQVRADEALDHAEAQINWAIERAEVAIDGAHFALGFYSGVGSPEKGVIRNGLPL